MHGRNSRSYNLCGENVAPSILTRRKSISPFVMSICWCLTRAWDHDFVMDHAFWTCREMKIILPRLRAYLIFTSIRSNDNGTLSCVNLEEKSSCENCMLESTNVANFDTLATSEATAVSINLFIVISLQDANWTDIKQRNGAKREHDKSVELYERHKYRGIPFRSSIMSRMFWNVEEVNKLRDTFGKFYASITTWLILCWWRTLALEPLIQTISGDSLCSKRLKFTVVFTRLG